ncbi:MAG: hypothetical protein LAP21_10225 [Acidobacteriia bacterium]|nr:hypothetical protein [Terriglobia bacterium]
MNQDEIYISKIAGHFPKKRLLPLQEECHEVDYLPLAFFLIFIGWNFLPIRTGPIAEI